MEAIQSSLPQTSVTSSAFQRLVDRGVFERLQVATSEEFEVANPDETAAFVNMRWVSDVVEPVATALSELKSERMAECHSLFTQLTRIFQHMQSPCTREDAGAGLSLLHLAAVALVRYKFVKVARKDSMEAQREVRKVVGLVWT
jgi:hypothetical protein